MENSIEVKMKRACNMAISMVDKSMSALLEHMKKCLDDKVFKEDMFKLEPLDQHLESKLQFKEEEAPLKSMGVVILRIQEEPALFCLGVTIEVSEGEFNDDGSLMTFIAACRTYEGLRLFARDKHCLNETMKQFKSFMKYRFHT